MSSEFAQMMETPELTLADYLGKLDAVCELPRHRSDQLDVCCELPGESDQLLISLEEDRHGWRNLEGNAVYLSDLDPRERLLEIILPWLTPKIACYSDSILWRLYRKDGGEMLVCVAKESRELSGVIRWEGSEITLESGVVAILERVNGAIRIRGEALAIETDRKISAVANL